MDLRKWLKKAGISQRELARRVGYSTNGPLSKIISGDAYVPPDAIPKWADALELKGDDRLRFIEECSIVAIPEWVIDNIKQLRSELKERNKLIDDLKSHGEFLQKIVLGDFEEDGGPHQPDLGSLLKDEVVMDASGLRARLAEVRRANRKLWRDMDVPRLRKLHPSRRTDDPEYIRSGLKGGTP